MKTNQKKLSAGWDLTGLLLVLCLLGMAFASMTAKAAGLYQLSPVNAQRAITNTVVSQTASSNLATVITNTVPAQQNGAVVQAYYAGSTSTNTSTCGLNWNVSYDGTNFLSTAPIWTLFTANGTAAVRDRVVIPQTNLLGVQKIKLAGITNDLVNGTVAFSNITLFLP